MMESNWILIWALLVVFGVLAVISKTIVKSRETPPIPELLPAPPPPVVEPNKPTISLDNMLLFLNKNGVACIGDPVSNMIVTAAFENVDAVCFDMIMLHAHRVRIHSYKLYIHLKPNDESK